jgi:hypothetical protein
VLNPDDQGPKIVFYHIPQIEVYDVTEDELRRIEDGYGQVSQDLTFAVASLTTCISFIIALVTAPLAPPVRLGFFVVVGLSGLCFIYTGSRWLRARRTTPNTIASIRSRRVAPEPPGQYPQPKK